MEYCRKFRGVKIILQIIKNLLNFGKFRVNVNLYALPRGIDLDILGLLARASNEFSYEISTAPNLIYFLPFSNIHFYHIFYVLQKLTPRHFFDVHKQDILSHRHVV